MVDDLANMHTIEELQEMMELRKQIDELQARYEAIYKRPLEESAAPDRSAITPPTAAQQEPKPTVVTPALPSSEKNPAPAAATLAPVAKESQPVKILKPVPKLEPLSPPRAQPVEVAAKAPSPAKPVTPPPSPVKPVAESPEPKAAAPVVPKTPEAKPTGGSLKDSVAKVIKAAGKPLAFDDIYSALEQGGYKLPEKKAKLVVRKVLFDKSFFKMVGKDKAGQGLYEVNEG